MTPNKRHYNKYKKDIEKGIENRCRAFTFFRWAGGSQAKGERERGRKPGKAGGSAETISK